MAEKFVTAGVAARLATVSVPTIQKYFDLGDIRGVKTSHGIRLIDAEDLARWIKERVAAQQGAK